jgi:hypothetical protein
LQDDLLDNPKRRRQLIEALHHRLREMEKRRDAADACATPRWGSCCAPRAKPCRDSKSFADWPNAQAARRLLAKHTREDNIRFDAFSRVTTSPTPPTGASSCRSWC